MNPLEKITWNTKRNESSIQLLSEEIIKMMVLFLSVEKRKKRKERTDFAFLCLEFQIMRPSGRKGENWVRDTRRKSDGPISGAISL